MDLFQQAVEESKIRFEENQERIKKEEAKKAAL